MPKEQESKITKSERLTTPRTVFLNGQSIKDYNGQQLVGKMYDAALTDELFQNYVNHLGVILKKRMQGKGIPQQPNILIFPPAPLKQPSTLRISKQFESPQKAINKDVKRLKAALAKHSL